MRFIALFRKEFRECLPWLLLAGVGLLLIFGLFLQFRERSIYGYIFNLRPGSAIESYQLGRYSELSSIGIWLCVISIGLGLALGIRQFWYGFFTKTWGFEIHRSVSRGSILWVKILASMTTFVMSLGIIWTFIFLYCSRPGGLLIVPTLRIYIEGWIYIALGFVIYLGTALSGLTEARWYTTKIFGIAFAGLVLLAITFQWQIFHAFLFVTIGIVILLSQVIYKFLCREF